MARKRGGRTRSTTTQRKKTTTTQVITPYGAKSYRDPLHRQFHGQTGKPQEAVVLDIDGTLEDWGATASKKVLEFCQRHHKKRRVLLVFTARTDYEFDRSFNWLVAHLPYPFIGPFCRTTTDPRYASEFKRHLAQGFEDMGLYRIMGAADDNPIVNDMWKQWAIDHFRDPSEFDLLECDYTPYGDWRKDVSRYGKGYSYPSTSAYSSPYVTWELDPVDKRYKKKSEFITQPKPGDPIATDTAWADYFVQREASGAYLCAPPEPEPPMDVEIIEVSVDIEEDARKSLYDDIGERFDWRYGYDELDRLALDDLQELLGMTPDEGDSFVDALNQPDLMDRYSEDEVRNKRIDDRMDIEDAVLKHCPDLQERQVYSMDVQDLLSRLDARMHEDEAQALPPSGAPEEGAA